jgi:hypothetical protein
MERVTPLSSGLRGGSRKRWQCAVKISEGLARRGSVSQQDGTEADNKKEDGDLLRPPF